ncbi:hypothetical protein ACQPZX_35060 [Actinoplanes sp. CA-142083]|uniref:hypothetical protein n=1 Tax=Actinoplanes sp. CA-142083 TaxID=3239903 RepID=UPI003D8CE9FF
MLNVVFLMVQSAPTEPIRPVNTDSSDLATIMVSAINARVLGPASREVGAEAKKAEILSSESEPFTFQCTISCSEATVEKIRELERAGAEGLDEFDLPMTLSDIVTEELSEAVGDSDAEFVVSIVSVTSEDRQGGAPSDH